MKLEKYYELFQAHVEVILNEVGITIEDESLLNAIANETGRAIPNDNDLICCQKPELGHVFHLWDECATQRISMPPSELVSGWGRQLSSYSTRSLQYFKV